MALATAFLEQTNLVGNGLVGEIELGIRGTPSPIARRQDPMGTRKQQERESLS